MGDAPLLSFIVPVRNDAARLTVCLAAIRSGTDGIAHEVVVADNGSTDDSAAVARQAGAQVLAMPGKRVAEMRNRAAQVAAAPLLAFVDADNQIHPGWSSHALAVLADPWIAATGAQYHCPPSGTWVQRTYDRLRRHISGREATTWLPSGNLIVRRTAFEAVGGFDTTLETCEDVDLCQRLIAQGDRLVEDGDLRSTHHGDPASLRALFLGELWRGRDNLRVSLRGPLTLRSIPGIAIPVLTVVGLIAIVLGITLWLHGGVTIAAAGVGLVLILVAVRAASLMFGAKAHLGVTHVVQAIAVAGTYNLARACALLVRGSAERRQRT